MSTNRVILPLESLGRRERVDQLAAARWAFEIAGGQHANLVVLCPLMLPTSFGLLPDPGPLSELRRDALALTKDVLGLVPPSMRAGVPIVVRAVLGELTALLGGLLTPGDVLVLPPADLPAGRWSGTGRRERQVARVVAESGAGVSRAAYALTPARGQAPR